MGRSSISSMAGECSERSTREAGWTRAREDMGGQESGGPLYKPRRHVPWPEHGVNQLSCENRKKWTMSVKDTARN
jgi:hypothetical protein